MKVSHNYSFQSVRLRPAISAAVLAIISSSLVEFAPAKPKDTIVTTITVAPWASGIAVSSDDTSVYVASILGQVSVIATSTDTVTSTISTGGYLDFIALAPGSGNLFATQFGPGPSAGQSLLYDVNLSTQNTTSAIIGQTGQLPAINASGTLLYVPSSGAGLPGTVQIFNPTSLQLLNVINVDGGPHQLVFTPDGAHAYVNNYAGPAAASGYLSYVDLTTATVKSTITNPAFNHPLYLAISPDGSALYVIQLDSFNSTGDQEKGILFFDTKTTNVTKKVALFNSGANTANSSTYFGIPALTVDGKYLYVPIFASVNAPPGGSVTEAIGNTVAVISTVTGSIVDTITVGAEPWQVAIGDAQRAYISNYEGGTVSVIDITE